MASNQKIIYVYESFKSTTPNFLGTLFVENVRGRESYSFEYDADWLKSSANYMYLDPDLQLYAGRQYPTGAKNVFGLFADSSPDRWGRLLMTRRERILAEQEGRKPRKLLDSDFLLGVYDETRMVFGHIHGNTDADYWPLIRENDLMLNAGADVNGFAPVTFEEMQENNYRHKAGWNPELCTMEADQ